MIIDIPGALLASDYVRCSLCGAGNTPAIREVGPRRMTCSNCRRQFQFNVVYLSYPIEARKEVAALDTSDLDGQDPAEAIETCNRILSKCDDVPERGEDFAESVREKAESIREWIEENDKVTEAQCAALENMESGLDRWLER
jgi:hypothetical protein